MEILDIRTLMICNSLMMFVIGLASMVLGKASGSRQSTFWWGGGCIAISVGILLNSLRGLISLYLSIPIGNFLILLGSTLIWAGLRNFMHRKSLLPLQVLISILPCIGIYWFWKVEPNLLVRCFFAMGTLAFLEFAMAREFFRGNRPVHKFTFATFAFFGIFYILWLFSSIHFMDSSKMLEVTAMFRVLYLVSIVFQILLISSLVMLLGDRLNEKLQKAKDAAEAASHAKSNFLATMSHEIRTPMCTIMGLSELGLNSAFKPVRREDLQGIHSASKSLLGLIDDVLDYSKIDAGESDLDRSEFYVDEVVDNAIDLICVQALSKGLSIGVVIEDNLPEKVVGDSGRLQQVLVNLMSNAVKFTPAGNVLLRVELGESLGQETVLNFCIEDTGIGIPAAEHDNIFDLFTQVDGSSTRLYGGVGLGLAICKRLVSLMGGNISIENIQGGGTCFKASIPFSVTDIKDGEPVIAQWQGKRALLLDRDESSAGLAKKVLKSFGFKVEQVRSTADLEIILSSSEESYELLLAEGNVGKEFMSSLDVILRDLESPPEPVYYMTRYEAGENGNIGPDIVVPVTRKRLFRTIAKVLKLDKSRIPCRFQEYRGNDMELPVRIPVLLVEDSEINRTVLSKMISSFNVEVKTACHGFEALEIIGKDKFALVFMDLQMPGMDGFEAAKSIREKLGDSAPPIVALSADVTRNSRTRVIEAGFAGYIPKPVELKKLHRILSEAAFDWETEKGIVQESGSLFNRSIPGLDLEAASRDYLGDEEFFCEQLQAFRDRLRSFVPIMKVLYAEKDYEEMKKISHSLRGTSALLKVVGVRDSLAAFEVALDGVGPEALEESFTLVIDACEEFANRVGVICSR